MKTIEYCVDGEAISDFYIQDKVREIAQGSKKNFKFSTENIFTAIRLAVVQGIINHDEIVFKFGNEKINVNKFGAIPNCPKGFCDLNVSLSEAILRTVYLKKFEKLKLGETK